MEYTVVTKEEIKIIGKELKTSLKEGKDLQEIPPFWEDFLTNNTLSKIPNKSSQAILGVYTNYTEDQQYSLILGSEVSSTDEIPADMVSKIIPPSKYALFTVTGPISVKIPEFWSYLWATKHDFERSFVADFEVYDERAADPQNATVDIYISIK